jgi:hypothetical protein
MQLGKRDMMQSLKISNFQSREAIFTKIPQGEFLSQKIKM